MTLMAASIAGDDTFRDRRSDGAGSGVVAAHNAAKAQVASAGVNPLGHACGWAITTAITGRTQKRAALDHLARQHPVLGAGIDAVLP